MKRFSTLGIGIRPRNRPIFFPKIAARSYATIVTSFPSNIDDPVYETFFTPYKKD